MAPEQRIVFCYDFPIYWNVMDCTVERYMTVRIGVSIELLKTTAKLLQNRRMVGKLL